MPRPGRMTTERAKEDVYKRQTLGKYAACVVEVVK